VNLTTNIGPLTQAATIVVPVATVAEASGTFVNGKGIAQQYARAVRAPMGIKSGWETLVEIGRRTGRELSLAKLPEVRAAMPAHAATVTTPAGA
jgi:NADH-quinone oxidoreductase subunit G